ncbi:hypothetical protein SHIRM173S_02302 [Streptomyces hirsutus]
MVGVGTGAVQRQQPVRSGPAAVDDGAGEGPQPVVGRGCGPGGVEEDGAVEPVRGQLPQQAGESRPVPLVDAVSALGDRAALDHGDDPAVGPGGAQRVGPFGAEHHDVPAAGGRDRLGRRGPDGFEGAEFAHRGGRGGRCGLAVLGDEVGGDGVHGRVLEEQGGIEGGADQVLQPLGGLEHVDRVEAEFVEADIGRDLRCGPVEVFCEHRADAVGHGAGPAGLLGGVRLLPRCHGCVLRRC